MGKMLTAHARRPELEPLTRTSKDIGMATFTCNHSSWEEVTK